MTGHSRTERSRSPIYTGQREDLPLSEYAIIGDGRTAALVATDSAIDWLCYGRFDGSAVFCRLLDIDQGGYFQVAPLPPFTATRKYLGQSNVLETEFECSTGRIRLTDAMSIDADGGTTLLRRVDGLSGGVELHVEFVPTFDFARATVAIELDPGGCQASAAGQRLRLSCPAPMQTDGRAAVASFVLRAGQTRWLVLTQGAPPLDDAAAERALQTTLDTWERWSCRGRYPEPYKDLVRRSALVLKLLIHTPTGAMVAAPTTSLPEVPGGERNWDYRFSWLRDASALVSALMTLGYHDESIAFIDWLESLNLAREAPAVCYDLGGKPPANEQELRHLLGYRGSRPVRIGNAAAGQDQHDIFGEVVSAIHMCSDAVPSLRPLPPPLWQLVSTLAEMAAGHWEQPDHGMWEVRDRPRHFVFSKLLCWTAIDRALAIAQRDRLQGPLMKWETDRERIRGAIMTAGFDEESGGFRRAFGESGLDAALLLFPRYGLVPADDPRFGRTVALIRERLSSGGLLRRYLGPDGLPGTEGLFAACSFWLAETLARQGCIDEARTTFELVVARANDLGLLSEEISVDTGELLGNFPQAFTHHSLIRAAVAIAEAEKPRL